jgi:hypothetical protein
MVIGLLHCLCSGCKYGLVVLFINCKNQFQKLIIINSELSLAIFFYSQSFIILDFCRKGHLLAKYLNFLRL